MINYLDIKASKSIKMDIYLKKFPGVGSKTCSMILNDLCVGKDMRLKNLSQTTFVHITQWFEKHDVKLNNTRQNKHKRYT